MGVLSIAVAHSTPVDVNTLEAQGTAPYGTKDEGVLVGGYVCDTWQYARIYYPVAKSGGAALGKVPIVSFAHGVTEGGLAVPANYHILLSGVASYGYVVIAQESAVTNFCANQDKDQQRSIEWVKSSKYSSKVDWGKKTGVFGHSMGGMATIKSASSSSAIKAHNIGAAVMLHPCAQSGSAKVPSLFFTGSLDTVCLSTFVKAAYNSASTAKAYAQIRGATHLEPQTGFPNRETIWVAAMFDCHIKGDQHACGNIYGKSPPNPCYSLCTCQAVPMSECHHTNEPIVMLDNFNETVLV